MAARRLARPAGEPLWDAIAGAMLAHYESAPQAPDGEWMAGLKLGAIAIREFRDIWMAGPSLRRKA